MRKKHIKKIQINKIATIAYSSMAISGFFIFCHGYYGSELQGWFFHGFYF